MPVLDRNGWISVAILLAVAGVALALRIPQLERRPLHNDEANQAAKLGILLETGVYQYDPHDHHGPTLYYLTLPLARLVSGRSFAATEIRVYRAVTVASGLLLAMLVLGAGEALGRGGATAAAFLTAVSPAMVYFSRFYIQEMLLVTFTFGLLLCLWRCLRTPSLAWAAGAGASAGLMYTTKETCVLAWAALAATAGVHVLRRWRGLLPAERGPGWRHLAVGVGVATVISVVLFSSFLTHWRGPLDAVRAYVLFLGRGAATDNPHGHPFDFYLRILTYWRPIPRLVWGEDMILGLGLAGGVVAWVWPRRLQGEPEAVRLLGVYTVLLTLIYSFIPYKTTWCLLSFWHGWILLAGVGTATLVMWPRRVWQRLLLALLLTAGAVQLGQRAWRAAHRYSTDVRNPYVYAQTGMDFLRLVDRMNALSVTAPEGKDMRIYVVAPADQTWPLPWYLRRFTCVGYWTTPAPEALATRPEVFITSPELAEDLPEGLLQHYMTEYYGLRPEVLLAVYIRIDLWDRFLRSRLDAMAQNHPQKEP